MDRHIDRATDWPTNQGEGNERIEEHRGGVFGAAAIALAIGGFAQPTVALAEKVWDIGEFDSCSKKAEDRFITGKTNSAQFADEIKFCCQMSGGEWTAAQECTAPPATFQTQPQTPGSVQAPRPGTATRN